MLVRKILQVGLMVACCVAVFPRFAEAARPEPATSKLVQFEGQLLDLSRGWGEAQACLIWDQANATACFRTAKELTAHIEQVKAANPSLMAACNSALWLYQDSSYMGRRLAFFDRGYWQNLGNYSFNDAASSFWFSGSCGGHLAEHSGGGGYWYPGNTGPESSSSTMPGWNDRLSSIYIQ